jgi:predicted ATPase/DNA-binding CsgD family transcriptional regulator
MERIDIPRALAIAYPGARRESSTPPSVGARPGDLPPELTSFVGRRNEVIEAKKMISASRLVTLTGPGGVGKTRLALRVAADVRRAFADGVKLVELSRLRDPVQLAGAVAESLGLREDPGGSSMAVLTDHLRERRMLLVLDNCEHMVEPVAVLTGALLNRCPPLRILTTGREPLGIEGEMTLPVPSLSVPDPRRSYSPQELSRFEAVTLFIDRARAKVPGFGITDDNQAAVVEICRRLDGLPLAIELAAVRIRALSAQQIADRLDDRYRLLTAGPRSSPTRQQTLRACIQWSHDLCSPREQLLWARLSIFSGGFRLDAAEGICAGDGLAGEDVLDLVSSLVDKSILMPEEHGPVLRYRMLETIREFGRERLRESGEYAELYHRHRRWYADLVARVNAALGIGMAAWRQSDRRRADKLFQRSLRLKQEMDDLLGAGWCLEALAWIAARERDHRRAATLLGAAADLSPLKSTSTAIASDLLTAHEQCVSQTRAVLGERVFLTAFQHGTEMSVDQAIGYALREAGLAAPAPAVAQESTLLTAREHQVAKLVAEGLSNKDIASRLVISHRTAEGHVEHILVKLGFTSRAQIAAWAAQRPTGDPSSSQRPHGRQTPAQIGVG